MTAQPNKAVVSTETNPTGYAPGEGDAYDYIPAWMNVPRLYQTEKQDVPLAVVKIFTPDASWTWYVLEYDGQDTAFGLVAGFEVEMGYFSISEIRDVKGPLSLPIERDLWFQATPVTQLPEYQAKWGERGGPYKDAKGLADLDALPDEYVSAERAGKVEATEDTHTAPTSDTPSTPDTDGKETEPAARKAKHKLPDGIPEAIEVDLGHTHGWTTAQVLRVNGKWLYYRLDDEAKVDKRKGKVQVYGRGIVWRVPEGEMTDA
jgi:hypothetical protein